MRKMPERLYVNEPYEEHNGDMMYEGRASNHHAQYPYILESSLPQPVTDVARVKALDLAIDMYAHLNNSEKFGGHINAIKAALSQPSIPVQDAKAIISNAEVQGETVALTGGANPPTGATQPEAIQKAVADLIKIAADLALGKHSLSSDQSDYTASVPKWLLNALERNGDNHRLLAIELRKVADCLRTHQSELEALKAENAALRRAVVDLSTHLEPEFHYEMRRKHHATISKAKAVRS